MALATADALSRRERLMLGAGVTVLSRVARLAERLDRHDRRHGRWSALPTQHAHKRPRGSRPHAAHGLGSDRTRDRPEA